MLQTTLCTQTVKGLSSDCLNLWDYYLNMLLSYLERNMEKSMSNGAWKMTKSIEIGPKKELKQVSIPPHTRKVTNGRDRWSMFSNLGNHPWSVCPRPDLIYTRHWRWQITVLTLEELGVFRGHLCYITVHRETEIVAKCIFMRYRKNSP